MIVIVMQEKQGILAGDSLNSTNSGAANIHMCVDMYVGSICRTGVQNFYFVTLYQNVRY